MRRILNLLVLLIVLATASVADAGIFGRKSSGCAGGCASCSNGSCSSGQCGQQGCGVATVWQADKDGDLACFQGGVFKGWYLVKSKTFHAYDASKKAYAPAPLPASCGPNGCPQARKEADGEELARWRLFHRRHAGCAAC